MKKVLFYTLAVFAILGAILAYILYSEGAFDAPPPKQEKIEPFMKCEAGKCAVGKCGANP